MGPCALVAERPVSAERYAEFEIIGPPEIRDVDSNERYFNRANGERRIDRAADSNVSESSRHSKAVDRWRDSPPARGVRCIIGALRGKSMYAQVSIRFNPDVTIEFRVPFTSDATAQARARDWLDRTYGEFGCEPARSTGKVVLLDKILGIAGAAGEKHFERDSGWGELYAQAVTSALDRTRVLVDVEGRTVSS